MSDLVVRGRSPLEPLDEAKHLIARAVADDDTDTLFELRARASAVELYARRADAREVANDSGEIKVRSEAGLGKIDRKLAPHGVKQEFRGTGTLEPPPLENVHQDTRAAWRKLAVLPDGAFDERVAALRADENAGVSTQGLLQGLAGAHVGHASGENEWYTPRAYIEAAVRVMGAIDLDPASNPDANRVVGAARIYTAEDDGLTKKWRGRVWMNPPYAQPLVADFCTKLVDAFSRDVSEACVLVNNATETNWFQTVADTATALCFPRGRVTFWHPTRKSASPLQGQALLYLGAKAQRFREEFEPFGFAVTR